MLRKVYVGPKKTIEAGMPVDDIINKVTLRYSGPNITVNPDNVDENLARKLPDADFYPDEYQSISTDTADKLLRGLECPGLTFGLSNYGDVEDKMDWITLTAKDEATGHSVSQTTLLGSIIGWENTSRVYTVQEFCEGIALLLNEELDKLR
jgi:hypothetical protein